MFGGTDVPHHNTVGIHHTILLIVRRSNDIIQIHHWEPGANSGKFGFDNRAVSEGKKLQLPLYAIAAQMGLGLGDVREGFYFHLLAAEPSSFKMSTYKDRSSRGAEAAMNKAAEIGWQTVSSIKNGYFAPRPPENGCPDYCPAADFCWKYQPRRW